MLSFGCSAKPQQCRYIHHGRRPGPVEQPPGETPIRGAARPQDRSSSRIKKASRRPLRGLPLADGQLLCDETAMGVLLLLRRRTTECRKVLLSIEKEKP